MDARVIGIFDSGVGGLTVYREVRRRLRDEHVVYLGDTARIPYGTRSPGTVLRYAREDCAFLLRKAVRVIVVACNTVSAVALADIRGELPVPVVGVLEPGARRAVEVTRNGRIGVIATETTVESETYQRTIAALAPEARTHAVACPLFVPLVEEGWHDHPVTETVVRSYLGPLVDAGIDTLVLGCTHYPLLGPVIGRVLGPEVTLVDSGECAAIEVVRLLGAGPAADPLPERIDVGDDEFWVTDSGRRFRRIAERILDGALPGLRSVDAWATPEGTLRPGVGECA